MKSHNLTFLFLFFASNTTGTVLPPEKYNTQLQTELNLVKSVFFENNNFKAILTKPVSSESCASGTAGFLKKNPSNTKEYASSVEENSKPLTELEKKISQKQQMIQYQQEDVLYKNGGIRDIEWINLEAKRQLAKINILQSDNQLLAIKKKITEEEYNKDYQKYQKQEEEILRWKSEQLNKYYQGDIEYSKESFDTLPYLQVFLFHKTKLNESVIPIEEKSNKEEYFNRLASFVLEKIKPACPNTEVVIFKHLIQDLGRRHFYQSMFTKEQGNWIEGFVKSTHFKTPSSLASTNLIASVENPSSYAKIINRDFYHPENSSYEVSLMKESENTIVIPGILKKPEEAEVEFAFLREAHSLGQGVSYTKKFFASKYFGGFVTTHIKVRDLDCSPNSKNFKCRFAVDFDYGASGGGAIVGAKLLQNMKGRGVSYENFKTDLTMTEQGWRSSGLNRWLKARGNAYREGMLEGLSNAFCSTANSDPENPVNCN